MLSEEVSQFVERRSQSHSLIQELDATRTEMLSLYSHLVGFKPFVELDEDTRDILEEFCETLVDYTLQAHLNLYRFIEEKQEKRQRVVDLAEKIYPSILKTTDIISRFNDSYEVINDNLDPDRLETDLSVLGQTLAERIELEDQLIDVLSTRVAAPQQLDS